MDRKHIIDSGDSVHSQRSNNSTASPLPAKVASRSFGNPLPIGRPGHSKSSSVSTAQSVTLTPTSSLDGGPDFHDYSRRGKEEYDFPSRITTTLGEGFDFIPGNRDRANTAPGPISEGFIPGRPRSVSRDGVKGLASSSRPPLSGTSYNQDYGDSRLSGIISRPGYVHSVSDKAGPETLLSSSYSAQQPVDHQHVSQKFGSLPSLSSQLSQQRGQGLNPNQPSFQPLRHQRSFSTPGPNFGQFQQEESHYMYGNDIGSSMAGHNEYGISSVHPSYGNFSTGVGNNIPRGDLYRQSSLQAYPSGSGSGFRFQNDASTLHRRESLDFVPGHARYPEPGPVIASGEEMRIFMSSDFEPAKPSSFQRHEGVVSPGHSPHQQYYGGHSRHRIDSLASPPLARGGNVIRSIPAQSQNAYGTGISGIQSHRVPSVDEELSHPLAGESIEVPFDDNGYMHESPSLQSGLIGSADVFPSRLGGTESSHHLPTAGASLPVQKSVYSVKFKRTQRNFVIGPRLNRDLKIGTYVKVEADRGEDLGIVVGKVPCEKRSSFRGEIGVVPATTGASGSGSSESKRIIRLATHDEVSLLVVKREEEDELLKICRGKVRHRGLPMNVVDAEYQFDRNKLTFFFEADGRVDFRELVRDLFSIYKTRIWMQQLDKNTAASCQAAVNPPVSDPMDYNTPIIAPMSEFREFVTGEEIEAG
eukprot:scaffold22603_cov116-Cylindrotheca_fusiformis.AAC.4